MCHQVYTRKFPVFTAYCSYCGVVWNQVDHCWEDPTVETMQIGSSDLTYEWVEDWVKIPDTETGRVNGRTHGVAVTDSADRVMIFHQASPAVLQFCPGGGLLRSWGDRFAGAHGMTCVKEGQTEYLWLTDEHSGEVVKTTLAGQTVLSIIRPNLPLYQNGKYAPTSVAVNQERFGGNGDIWVADGYGASCIHRYDKTGRYVGTITGQEGKAGLFKCPHGIWFDTRHGQPELYIADRGNTRVQVYDADGRFKRSFGSNFLSSPCGFASYGPYLMIPELHARVTILDEYDNPMCYLGANEAACKIKGWPNLPSYMLEPGKFNSPHAMAADKDGNLYVVEWILGGRVTKLVRC